MSSERWKQLGQVINELGTFALWLAVALLFSIPVLVYLASQL